MQQEYYNKIIDTDLRSNLYQPLLYLLVDKTLQQHF